MHCTKQFSRSSLSSADTCKGDSECGAHNYICVEGFCQPVSGTRVNCTAQRDCPPQKAFDTNIYDCRNGVCTSHINMPLQCSDDYNCGAFEKCTRGRCVESSVHQKKRLCNFDEDCPEDHRCIRSKCEKRAWWQPFRCAAGSNCLHDQVCYNSRCTLKSALKTTHSYRCDTEGTGCKDYSHPQHVCDKGLCTMRGNVNPIKCTEGGKECAKGFMCREALPWNNQLYCVAEKLMTGKSCALDSECALGYACRKSQCVDQVYLYYNQLCSYDGHCYNKSCVAGGCIGFNLKPCKSVKDCPDYQYCSTNNYCHYPQREMNPGEPLPCLTDAECPNGRVCFHNGCVRRSMIPDSNPKACHSHDDCERTLLCYDGYCLKRTMIPTAAYNGLITKPKVDSSRKNGFGFPARGRDCTSDLTCRLREICVNGKCQATPKLNNCTSDADCPAQERVCHRGRCLYVLE